VAKLPDELYTPETPVEEWLKLCKTAGPEGFAPGELGQVSPLDFNTHLESVIRIPSYMIFNVLPFIVPFGAFWMGYSYLIGTILVIVILMQFNKGYPSSETIRSKQYLYTERNNQKYTSLKLVWPKTMNTEAFKQSPTIFCIVPHGVAPLGVCAYPFFSKLWSNRLCHWTAAPVVLQLPLIGGLVKNFGTIPAKAKNILDMLGKKGDNVGVVLDGIAGMFQGHDENVQKAHLNDRDTIVSLALESGASIVPLYGFGTTSLWSIVVDPFGVLEWLSLKLNISIVPFYGRWGLPMGPPRRNALTVAFGEPVVCPQISRPAKTADKAAKDAYKAKVQEYHQKMLASFKGAFDKHKAGYGVPKKQLVFV